MRLKNSMLTIVAFSTLFLTACGGGNSSSASKSVNSNNEIKNDIDNNTGSIDNDTIGTDSLQKRYGYQYVSGKYLGGINFAGYAVNKQTLTVSNDILYEKQEYPLATTDFVPENHRFPTLTRSQLYSLDYSESDLGYKAMFLEDFNESEMSYSPYNISGSHELILKSSYDVIDISNKKISSLIFLAEENNVDLIKPIQKSSMVFPEGSRCYKNTLVTANQDFISLAGEWAGFSTLQEWAAAEDPNGSTLVSEVWAGYPVMYSNENSAAAVDYNGKIFGPFKDNKGVYFDINTYIDTYKKLVTENPDSEELKKALYAIENECFEFNKVAADAIDALIMQQAH